MLVGSIAAAFAARRRRPRSPQIARASEQLLERLGWLKELGVLLALVPGTIALFSGSPWQAQLWWWLLGYSALIVLSLILGTLIGLARRWPSWRHQLLPHERRATIGVTALMLTSALVIPAALVLLTVLGIDAMTAIPVSLALGYGLWQTAYAIARTSPSLSQATG